MAGSGLGTLIFAPLVALCIQRLGWRNTILILSATVSMCAAFGSLFRPLKPKSTQKIPDEPFGNNNEQKLCFKMFNCVMFLLFSDQNEEKYKIDIEIIPRNGQNGFRKKPTHTMDSSQPPKISVIPEEGQIFRSQSVGNRSYLKQTQTNGTSDDAHGFLSESLLNNIKFGKKSESRSLGDVYRYSSGALARPDIFYQVRKKNRIFYDNQLTIFEFIGFRARYATFHTINRKAIYQKTLKIAYIGESMTLM